jgi:hypothetical protein
VAAPYATEVAFDGRFYVLDDTEVDVVDSTGDLVATFAAPEGMILQSLEVVAPHLAIIASPLRGGPSELLLYELPR